MKVDTNKEPEPGVEGRGFIKGAGLTDTGKVRDHNEDAFSIVDDLSLFIVSDGMGGHRAGEVASKMVVETLPIKVTAAFPPSSNVSGDQMVTVLRQAIGGLSRLLRERASEISELKATGATVVACLIRGKLASIAHMGDSRSYLMRKGVLEQLTEDHTIVALLIQLGQITRRQAAQHPLRHVLTRHVGMQGDLGPEIGLLELRYGDRLLLCSDGLTNEVSDREIGEILWSEPDIQRACKRLVHSANQAGGKDNITVLIIQYGDPGSQSHREKRKVLVRRTIGRSLRRKEADAEGI